MAEELEKAKKTAEGMLEKIKDPENLTEEDLKKMLKEIEDLRKKLKKM